MQYASIGPTHEENDYQVYLNAYYNYNLPYCCSSYSRGRISTRIPVFTMVTMVTIAAWISNSTYITRFSIKTSISPSSLYIC